MQEKEASSFRARRSHGYQPERPVGTTEVVVWRKPALSENEFSAVIFEECLPASFFTAELRRTHSQGVLTRGTGSGNEAGRLLHELCVGLTSGTFTLEAPENDDSWCRKKVFLPEEDGAEASVHVTPEGLVRVDIEERSSLVGSSCELTIFCGDNQDLALRVGEAVSEGMLVPKYRHEVLKAIA